MRRTRLQWYAALAYVIVSGCGTDSSNSINLPEQNGQGYFNPRPANKVESNFTLPEESDMIYTPILIDEKLGYLGMNVITGEVYRYGSDPGNSLRLVRGGLVAKLNIKNPLQLSLTDCDGINGLDFAVTSMPEESNITVIKTTCFLDEGSE